MKFSFTGYLLFLLLSTFLFYSCDCNVDQEHSMTLKFLGEDGEEEVRYRNVYGVGGDGNIEFESDIKAYKLPLSMHHDSVVFVLESYSDSVDTLTIRYSREVIFEDRACGFIMKYNDLSIGQTTTFSDVDIYTSYREIRIHI